MKLVDIAAIFNRAFAYTLNRQKLILMYIVLLLCGLLTVFFRGLGTHANDWVVMSLTFLPLFLSAGVLLSTGIVLIRIYHDELKNRPVSYRETLKKSWELVIGASYFSIPVIMIYLLLWIMMGMFLLFSRLPLVGEFFSVILAFGPFLINLGSIVLCIVSVALLFYVAPALALKGLNGTQITQNLIRRFKYDLFSNIFLACIAIIPLAFVLGMLSLAGSMTGTRCFVCTNPLFAALRWFFIMIPFVAVLTPALIFFFNFAAESHVLIHKAMKKN